MSKVRHRAELLGILRAPVPLDYDYAPKNRAQRRACTKAGRKPGDNQAPKRGGK